MLSLILMAAIAQATASDGPTREWLPGVINGQTVQVWGWRLNGGRSVGYFEHENSHLFRKPGQAPTPTPSNFPPGITLGADGEMTAGVDLRSTRPTAGFTTNDPELGRKIGLSSDDETSCGGPDPSPINLFEQYKDYLPAIGVGVLLLLLLWPRKHPER